MSGQNISSELLKRYVEGKCTPEEVFLVDEWYASLDAASDQAAVFDQKRHLRKVTGQIGIALPEETEERPLGRPVMRMVLRYAVAAMLLVAFGWGGYFLASRKQSLFNEGSTVSVRNQTRQVRKHAFPDGSTAWLNPGARISYSKSGFSATSREVTLDGEAFFEVTHDAARPFWVNSESVHVRVLGTSFNVRARRGEPQYSVSVVTGKVSVTADQGRQVTLLPNQQATFKVASGELVAEKVPLSDEKMALWQPVSLTFADAKLGEVVTRLQEKFDVTIRLANPDLANCRVKATFDNNRLAEILEMTMQIVDADYQMQNGEIVISGEGCPSAE